MKAVIMAGGEGRRLKSVSGDIPKPMVPFLGRPMMEHILLLLKKHGFTHVCASLCYRPEDIISYFGSGEKLGISLEYRIEKEKLGTAGGVKNCADFIGNEDFLVISGDAACDFDLAAFALQHKAASPAASLALFRCSQPLSYGLALTDSDSEVRAFIEKPSWERVVTDLVNTGIYMLSPRVLDFIPEGTPFDFGKELFPLLLSRSEKILGIEMEGYWCDVGSPLSYYRCCVDALEGRLKADIPQGFRPADKSAEIPTDDSGGLCLECACKNRARLMAELSRIMLDMGADYSDGIRLGRLHIAPLSRHSAVMVRVSGEETEHSKALAFSAEELIKALDL